MSRTTHAVPVVKSEPGTAGPFPDDAMAAAPPHHQPARVVVLADLNVDPPMSDGDEPLPVPAAPSPFNSRYAPPRFVQAYMRRDDDSSVVGLKWNRLVACPACCRGAELVL